MKSFAYVQMIVLISCFVCHENEEFYVDVVSIFRVLYWMKLIFKLWTEVENKDSISKHI